jgi:hypothetical protein
MCTVELQDVVNNIKEMNVAMNMLQKVPFALLPTYKTFRIAVNNVNTLTP